MKAYATLSLFFCLGCLSRADTAPEGASPGSPRCLVGSDVEDRDLRRCQKAQRKENAAGAAADKEPEVEPVIEAAVIACLA